MDLRSEEDVKIKHVVAMLEGLGYDPDRIRWNVPIEVKQGRKKKTIYADGVADADGAQVLPLLVIETKPPTEKLTEGDRDQAISYARLNATIVPVVVLSNGLVTKAYDTFTKKELKGGVPTKDQLLKDLKKRSVSDGQRGALASEAKHELFRIDDVQEFKRILRASHNVIRNNEGYDPTKAFDELSKVMFCKLYEEKRKGTSRFRVGTFDDALDRLGHNVIQTIFNETKADTKFKGLFQSDETIQLSDRTIRELVRQFESYDLSLTDFDVKGEAFEHFLGDTFTGGLGQYFTPRTVVQFIIDALGLNIGEKVIDPFCGTGGFLIYAYHVVSGDIQEMKLSEKQKASYLRELEENCLFGTDWNERTSQACRMNMTVHGEGDAGRHIFMQSGFEDREGEIEQESFQVVATNPPFGSSETDPDILAAHELGAGRKSIERAALAMERTIRLTEPGGRIGIVIMDGILSNRSMQYVREYVLKHTWVRGLVSLPPETFEGYGGRSNTTILFLDKKATPDDGQQEDVFMAVCSNSGYGPTGVEIEGNELPAILEAYRSFRSGAEADCPNTWVASLNERLDPKHYWRPAATVGLSIGERLNEAGAAVGGLADLASGISKRVAQLDREVQTTALLLEALIEEVTDKVTLDANTKYDLLGVRWWGGGAFIRETKEGRDVSASKLNKVARGQLVYNRLFAFRGSFAVVGDECDGAHASNEFPTFVAKGDREDADVMIRYLVHVMNSPQTLEVVDAMSSGSTKTSRNRLNQREFLKMTVNVPTDPEEMRELVELMDLADEFRRSQEEAVAVAKRLRDGVAQLLP